MPSICVIADTHRLHRELAIPECDLLIHGGDMCSFQRKDQETLEDIDHWFAEVPARQVVCIGGNHDFPLYHREFRFSQATYLQDAQSEAFGLSIYGSPWCPDLSGFAFYASEADLIEKWRKIPAGIDILITHTPPAGILDLPSSGDRHLGCPHLRAELERIRPRYHFFGHVHASAGRASANGVEFINAAMAGGRDFRISHQPWLLEIERCDE